MKKILIIINNYIPHNSAMVVRWKTISEYMASMGYDVSIITSGMKGVSDFEIINNVKVYRTKVSYFKRLMHKTSSAEKVNLASKANNTIKYNFKVLAVKSLRVLYNTTWKKIYFPDSECIWYFKAVTLSKKLIKDNDFDIIYTVALPFTCHLVGIKLKKLFNIFWVADYGDPFSFVDETPSNNMRLYKNLNIKVEGHVLKSADKIVLTTEGTLYEYSKLFEESARKMEVIGQVTDIDENFIKSIKGKDFYNKKDKINFIFAGTLYRKIRNPEYFLNMLCEIKKNADINFIFHIFGEINDTADIVNAFKEKLGENLEVHGLVNRDEMLPSIIHTDFLVNLGNSSPYRMPSKIVEYMAFNKGIINVIDSNADCSLDITRGYKKIVNIVKDNDFKSNVNSLVGFINHKDNFEDTVSEIVKKYSAKEITLRYVNIKE